jgi:16S rRNA (guanine966-N2)-methyltransferase
MLRIISGEFRSRQLHAPKDDRVTRPYPSRVREAVFNTLREWFEGATVLDLFAGVGSMGLEAVSRGAANVVMVERSKPIFKLLQQNIEELGCANRAQAVMGDALAPRSLLLPRTPIDVIFLDPPYLMMMEDGPRQQVLDQLDRCATVLRDGGLVVFRSPLSAERLGLEVPHLDGPEERHYGKDMYLMYYQKPKPAASTAEQSGDLTASTDDA